jgi:DUF1680 family protein
MTMNRRHFFLAGTLGALLLIDTLVAELNRATGAASDPVKLLPLQNVAIADSFWAPKLKVYREKTIPHSWFYMQWELRSLRKAAGQQVDGELNGTWGEANLYKFLETAAYSLAMGRDPTLEAKVDEVVALLAAGQQPDGYLHVYVTNNKKTPWDPAFLDGSHDGYVLGHMIEAAIAYHATTGKRAFLDIACKAADQAWRHFLGPDGQPGFCGHAELEMALVELYRVTHETRYLELARAFVEWRGRGKVKPAGPTPRAYFQDQVPLRAQRTLDGHAVRAIFFGTGVADLALETGESDYRVAAHRFWDSTTMRRMTITGSTGPRKEHEAFGEDYELPNDGYYESCAACGLADFAQRMFLLERRAESADVLERVLYNAILHGISLSGTNTYYCNPLSDRDHLRDNCWVCCPPNLSRTLLQAGRYAYAHTQRDLYVNLYVGGKVRVPFPAGEVTLRVETDYPWDGRVSLRVESPTPATFALQLRKPGWCVKADLNLNGTTIGTQPNDSGFWTLTREWRKGDSVEVVLDMPVQLMVAHPNIVSCRGKVALQRGPLVYAFEGLDNGGAPNIILGPDPRFTVERKPDLLEDITVIHGRAADGKPIQAIPFFALANRGSSAQEVWVRQLDLRPGDDWWLGSLYRPVPTVNKHPAE